ncbi:MAG: hypothetical protein HY271_00770 [Deltaproteobacteria bacterium]|nr:hypothetical protein [Deltaproteobacteria bacterium]
MSHPLLARYHKALRASGITPPADRPATTGAAALSAAPTPERDRAFADIDAYLVESRVLGEAVWLTSDDATAERLERELAVERDTRLVFSLAEVEAMCGMLAADMQTLAAIKRRLRGSRIDHVTLREGNADA